MLYFYLIHNNSESKCLDNDLAQLNTVNAWLLRPWSVLKDTEIFWLPIASISMPEEMALHAPVRATELYLIGAIACDYVDRTHGFTQVSWDNNWIMNSKTEQK